MEKISYLDKIVGVLTEPHKLFSKLNNQKHKISDWFLTIVILIVVSSISDVVIQSNPEIAKRQFEERISKVEQFIEKSFEQGKISREKANKIIDEEYDKAKFYSQPSGLIWNFITKFVFIFIGFFIFSFLSLFIMNSTFYEIYKLDKVLLALGLPMFILTLESVVNVILSLLFISFAGTISVIFYLWYLFVFFIGLYKLHNARRFWKYPLMFFGLISVFVAIAFILLYDYFLLLDNYLR